MSEAHCYAALWKSIQFLLLLHILGWGKVEHGIPQSSKALFTAAAVMMIPVTYCEPQPEVRSSYAYQCLSQQAEAGPGNWYTT